MSHTSNPMKTGWLPEEPQPRKGWGLLWALRSALSTEPSSGESAGVHPGDCDQKQMSPQSQGAGQPDTHFLLPTLQLAKRGSLGVKLPALQLFSGSRRVNVWSKYMHCLWLLRLRKLDRFGDSLFLWSDGRGHSRPTPRRSITQGRERGRGWPHEPLFCIASLFTVPVCSLCLDINRSHVRLTTLFTLS